MTNQKEVVRELLSKEKLDFEDLSKIMQLLRAPGGCPWDREQTHRSIRSCMIEEAYEVVEAIDTEDPVLLREELGDVLFQVIFHSQLEAEEGRFDVTDVVHDICVKMIHRHPHVFSETEVSDSADALVRWESIKTEEKQRNTLASRLRAVPPMLPALMRAAKISKKAGLLADVTAEELQAQLQERAAALGTSDDAESELGELLLAAAKLAAARGIDAEEVLGRATEGVILRVEAEENEKNAKKMENR